MLKLVNKADLKSVAVKLVGSSPTTCTKIINNIMVRFNLFFQHFLLIVQIGLVTQSGNYYWLLYHVFGIILAWYADKDARKQVKHFFIDSLLSEK